MKQATKTLAPVLRLPSIVLFLFTLPATAMTFLHPVYDWIGTSHGMNAIYFLITAPIFSYGFVFIECLSRKNAIILIARILILAFMASYFSYLMLDVTISTDKLKLLGRIVLGSYLLLCLFAARTLYSHQIDAQELYVGGWFYFFLFCMIPVGVFFIQPKARKYLEMDLQQSS